MARRRRTAGPGAPADQPEGPPTVLSLEWDHGDSMLVDRSPGVWEVRFVDPLELGLDLELVARLASWVARCHALTPYLIGERRTSEDDEAYAVLQRDLVTLAHDVAHQLAPDVEVLVEGRPIREQRSR